MKTIGRLMVPIETQRSLEEQRGFKIVEVVAEKDGLFALVKVPVEDLPNLRVLKTSAGRREYQREIQRKYRKRLKKRNKGIEGIPLTVRHGYESSRPETTTERRTRLMKKKKTR